MTNYTGGFFLFLETGKKLLLEDFADLLLETSNINPGTTIANTNADTRSFSGNEICDRTGFKVLPGDLVEEWNGHMVRPESFEPQQPQDKLRSRPDKLPGSVSPEPSDTFISTAVSADDL